LRTDQTSPIELDTGGEQVNLDIGWVCDLGKMLANMDIAPQMN